MEKIGNPPDQMEETPGRRAGPVRAMETSRKRTRMFPEQISRKLEMAHVRVAHVSVVVLSTTYYPTALTRQQDPGNNGIGQISTGSSMPYRLKTTISLIKEDLCCKLDLIPIKILLQAMGVTTSSGALCRQDGS